MITARQQYDQIANHYEAADQTIEGQYIVNLTFLSLIEACGGVEGQAAIDLACGGGTYTRILRELGAKRVVGLDTLEGQIQIARGKKKQIRLELSI
jgi:ubiquinone/menaquinone biosynthesis C-methylase UbiE